MCFKVRSKSITSPTSDNSMWRHSLKQRVHETALNMVVSYSLHDKLFALAFSQRFNTIATLTRKCGGRNSDADDPRRLHPFTALAARHPCNLWTSMSACPSYKASAIQSELWMGKIGTILKCVPPQAMPYFRLDVRMFSNNNQILSRIQ